MKDAEGRMSHIGCQVEKIRMWGLKQVMLEYLNKLNKQMPKPIQAIIQAP